MKARGPGCLKGYGPTACRTGCPGSRGQGAGGHMPGSMEPDGMDSCTMGQGRMDLEGMAQVRTRPHRMESYRKEFHLMEPNLMEPNLTESYRMDPDRMVPDRIS